MTYYQQLRSPQWLKFALQFKEAHNWTCEACGAKQSKENELTVHHIYYLRGVKPWDYPDKLLECLCWPCHKDRQSEQQSKLADVAGAMKGRSIWEIRTTFTHPRTHHSLAAEEFFGMWALGCAAFSKAISEIESRNPNLADVLSRAVLIGATSQRVEILLQDYDDLQTYYSQRGFSELTDLMSKSGFQDALINAEVGSYDIWVYPRLRPYAFHPKCLINSKPSTTP